MNQSIKYLNESTMKFLYADLVDEILYFKHQEIIIDLKVFPLKAKIH